MHHSPAEGERQALRGYQWQYDWIAERVFKALLIGDLVKLQLVNPAVGKVDDLVLSRAGQIDGYQFKSSESGAFLTFRDLTGMRKSRSGAVVPSLVSDLAAGWSYLQSTSIPARVRVHLVSNQLASPNDRIPNAPRGVSGHFRAFVAAVLHPIATGASPADRWQPALEALVRATELPVGTALQFLAALDLDLGSQSPVVDHAAGEFPEVDVSRSALLVELSDALRRVVANAAGMVELTQSQLIDLMGWRDRLELRSRHELTLENPDLYEPLVGALNELQGAIAAHDTGYLAVIGTPGSGKSTLLSQGLSGRSYRMVRYYAFLPGPTGSAQNRLQADNFVHDLVVGLDQQGLRSDRTLPPPDLVSLRNRLHEQLSEASRDYTATGRRTVLVVDGLDHVWRERGPGIDLLSELPQPEQLPRGVLFVVGSQSLAPTSPQIRTHLEDDHSRVIDLGQYRLSADAVSRIATRCGLVELLGERGVQKLFELSAGHPLALAYLCNRLLETDDKATLEQVLETSTRFEGDIRQQYASYWQQIEGIAGIRELFSRVSRLRGPIDLDWVSKWATATAQQHIHEYRHYFRQDALKRWGFFHDSFRQFVIERTSSNLRGEVAVDVNRQQFELLADLVASTGSTSIVRWEELGLRAIAGQDDQVLNLATVEAFRSQFLQFRGSAAIIGDIHTALRIAAERGSTAQMFGLILALLELEARSSVLDEIDVSSTLIETDLVSDALLYMLSGIGGRVPVSQQLRAVRLLYERGHPAARQLFDLCEPPGNRLVDATPFRDEDRAIREEWARIAPNFRPVTRVVDLARVLVSGVSMEAGIDRGRQLNSRELVDGAVTLLSAAAADLIARSRVDDALIPFIELRSELNELLAAPESVTQHANQAANSSESIARLVDGISEVAATAWQSGSLDRLYHSDLGVKPLEDLCRRARYFYPETARRLVDGLLTIGDHSGARAWLDRIGVPIALTSTTSRMSGSGELDARFAFWSLWARLVLSEPGSRPRDERIASVPAVSEVPVSSGPNQYPDAPTATLAAAMDKGVREFAILRTVANSDASAVSQLVPERILSIINLFRRDTQDGESGHGPSFRLLWQDRSWFVRNGIATCGAFGQEPLQRLRLYLADQFVSQRAEWPIPLKQEAAVAFARAGVPLDDEEIVLDDAERVLMGEADVRERARTTTEQVHIRMDLGYVGRAQDLARLLIASSFAVAPSDDNQLDNWCDALERALETNADRAAEWIAHMARVVVAARGVSGALTLRAGTRLPALLAPRNPVASVRLFEYMVRQGSIDHSQALAHLIAALALRVPVNDQSSLKLAVDLFGNVAIPILDTEPAELTEKLLGAIHMRSDEIAHRLLASLVTCVNTLAAPQTRPGWLVSLGLSPRAPVAHADSEYSRRLELIEGGYLQYDEVLTACATLEGLRGIRARESNGSIFDWGPLVLELPLGKTDPGAVANVLVGARRGSRGILELARQAHRSGDHGLAETLGRQALANTEPIEWARFWSGDRWDAWEFLIHDLHLAIEREARIDLVEALRTPRFPLTMFISDLVVAIALLDSSPDWPAMWRHVEAYLDGMAQAMPLPTSSPYESRPNHWWIGRQSDIACDFSNDSEGVASSTALAQLAADHVIHPQWAIRDGACRTTAWAAIDGHQPTIACLLSMAMPQPSVDPGHEDVAESTGRVLACAAQQNPELLKEKWYRRLEGYWRKQPSWALRGLARRPQRTMGLVTPVAMKYSIALAKERTQSLLVAGNELQSLPKADLPVTFSAEIRLVAEAAALPSTNLIHRDKTIREAVMRELISPADIQHALEPVGIDPPYVPPHLLGTRIALMRLLGQLDADGVLSPDVIDRLGPVLRTCDLRLLTESPKARPAHVPPSPEVDYRTDDQSWLLGLDQRVEEFLSPLANDDHYVLAEQYSCTPLTREHLSESFSCGVELLGPVAETPFASRFFALISDVSRDMEYDPNLRLGPGDPLALLQQGLTFMQVASYWVAFRPEVASAMGWRADPIGWGSWVDAEGREMVQTMNWCDGGRVFRRRNEGAVADGTLVLATRDALRQLMVAFKTLRIRWEITRTAGSFPDWRTDRRRGDRLLTLPG